MEVPLIQVRCPAHQEQIVRKKGIRKNKSDRRAKELSSQRTGSFMERLQ